MRKYSNEKGITLVALVLTVIILLILASVAVPTGRNVIQNSKLTAFSTELQVMQEKVNELNQEYKNGDDTVLNIGQSWQDAPTEASTAAFAGTGITDTADFRYYTKYTVSELGFENFSQEFLVNVKTRTVISLDGIVYDGNTYYTIEDIPDSLYNVEYEGIQSKPTFNLQAEQTGETFLLKVTEIEYNGNVKKGTIYYGQEVNGAIQWKTAIENTTKTSYEIEVSKEGTWYVKIVDAAGHVSDIEEIII